MIDREKLKILKVSVAVVICLGLTLVPIATASLPGFPDITVTTIYQDDFALITTYDFIEGDQVYVRFTISDPYADLDAFVWGPTDDYIWFGGKAPLAYEDPNVAEEGYFYIPETGSYTVFIIGYYVPSVDGVETEIFVDCDEALVVVPPLESSGVSYGTLKSYVNNAATAKLHASENAAFNRNPVDQLGGSRLTTREGFINWWTNGLTLYELPGNRFCADDPLAVGGQTWLLPGTYDYDTAAWLFGYYYYEHYIDGIPLSELTEVIDVPMQVMTDRGEVIWYAKIQEVALFKPGELVDLIGYGLHKLYSFLPNYGSEGYGLVSYFWLLPEGSTLPL